MTDECLATDVLIIGAGGAALRAALEAHQVGARVLMVSKSVAGKSGTTPTALTGYQAAFGHADPADNPQVHFQDTMRNGAYLSNPVLARILTDEAMASVLDLERLGVPFQKDSQGRFIQKRLDDSQSFPRSVRVGDSLGLPIMSALRREARRLKLPMLNDMFITRLATVEGRVCGAMAMDMASGRLVLIKAKVVILATGGAAEMYSLSSNPPEATGDGVMLAYEQGAELLDPEFFLFLGHCVLHPESAKGVLYPFQYLLGLGARPLYNACGESFVARYSADGSTNPSREQYARAVYYEVRAGRGSPHGGAFFDLSSLPRAVLDKELPSQTGFLEGLGADMNGRIEVGVAAHFQCGGVRIDPETRTTLPGLYAVGEVAGGVHGAARIGGNALAELFVFGKRAGRYAAQEALERPQTPVPPVWVRTEQTRVFQMLDVPGGVRPNVLKRQLQRLMWAHVGVVRNAQGLETALTDIKAMQRRLPGVGTASRQRVYNLDWIGRLELENMLRHAEIMVLAAQQRTESRATHFREDYPETLARWQGNFSVRNVDNNPVLQFIPIVF